MEPELITLEEDDEGLTITPEPQFFTRNPSILEVMGPISKYNLGGIGSWCKGRIHPTDITITVESPQGLSTGKAGDYILKDETHNFYALTRAALNEQFIPISVTDVESSVQED